MNPTNSTSWQKGRWGWSLLAAGFVVAAGLLRLVPEEPGEFQSTFSRREDVAEYELFAPAAAGANKHVLISNCYTINNIVGNVSSADSAVSGRHGVAYFGKILNFILRKQGENGAAFYDLGSSGTGITDHIFYLYHALHAANVKSIIYTNSHGGMYHFNAKHAETTLECLVVLEKLREQYPQAAEEIDAYRDALVRSPTFAAAKQTYGENWRGRIDPQTLTLGEMPATTDEAAFLRASQIFAAPSRLRDCVIHGYSLPQEQTISLTSQWDHFATKCLNEVARQYTDASHDCPFRMRPNRSSFFDGESYPLNVTFLNMLGKICRAESIRLVYYFPPNLAISASNYAQHFKPGYVDRVRKILAPYDAIIIDHTIDHDLNAFDFVWREHGGVRYKDGNAVNIVGNYKRGRRLLEAMRDAGLLRPAPNSDAVVWEGERHLPHLPRDVTPLDERREAIVDNEP